MTTEELYDKLKLIQKMKCETQNLELKSAEQGCPKRLYDSLSSFSNQDDGGIIVFGIDEKQDYKEVGVYDAQDIQKKINEQCLQMNPVVRPLITVVEKENKKFVSAEIPGIDLADRPCYYQGRGRLKGSYTRIGDSDEPMTEYEIYSYEAYRRKYQDDIREVPRVTLMSLDQEELNRYVELLKRGKQRLATLDNESIYELMSIKRGEKVTLSATLLFSPYPQAYFPQLCITAIVIPGRTIGSLGDMGERFSDNQRIEGTIPEFLDERGSFIVKLYKESKNDYEDMSNDEETNNLIVFCKTPRTRKEICDYLGLNSVTYAIQTYVNPLVEAGVIKLSIPDKPKSPKQLYYSVEREE